MKFLRYDKAGTAVLGVLRDDSIVSLETLSGRYPTMLSVINGGPAALGEIASFVELAIETVPLTTVRLLAPIERPGKFLAIGMNYRKHIAEAERFGVPEPKQQLWFNKQTSCIVGPYDDTDPGVTEKLDYEVELCAVIGTRAKSVLRSDAQRHVFGYTVANDISARDWQMHSPTFTLGKSFDTHGPIGPWIVTADEILDPHGLKLSCKVNGETRQSSDTGQMVHDIWDQIAYLSTAMTLEPGDLIATGTPEGVGAAMAPPSFLRPGDIVRCEIERIGVIENKVVVLRQ